MTPEAFGRLPDAIQHKRTAFWGTIPKPRNKPTLQNAMKREYEVMVGNIGCVYHGSSGSDAFRAFDQYKGQSQSGYGRAAHEDVYIMADGELLDSYNPKEKEDEP